MSWKYHPNFRQTMFAWFQNFGCRRRSLGPTPYPVMISRHCFMSGRLCSILSSTKTWYRGSCSIHVSCCANLASIAVFTVPHLCSPPWRHGWNSMAASRHTMIFSSTSQQGSSRPIPRKLSPPFASRATTIQLICSEISPCSQMVWINSRKIHHLRPNPGSVPSLPGSCQGSPWLPSLCAGSCQTTPWGALHHPGSPCGSPVL